MSGAEERELLEWAAKAAGKDTVLWPDDVADWAWNPRHDDGDSRRLEVALRLWIRYRDNGTINVCWYDEQGFFSGHVTEPLGCDPCDTTRLAVLRAAAAIGGAVGDDGFWHFEYPPMPVIDEICTSGCVPDQVSHQFYPTPPELAARVVEMADIKPGMSVLEPSAGQGGLADLMPGCLCVETAQLNFRVLTAKGHRALHVDFLAWVANWGADEKFARVVMNPPFDQGRWLAHVEAAAKLVASGGRLVAILPSGASKRLDLGDGWKCSWLGPLENQFPGVSVDVVILTADRVS